MLPMASSGILILRVEQLQQVSALHRFVLPGDHFEEHHAEQVGLVLEVHDLADDVLAAALRDLFLGYLGYAELIDLPQTGDSPWR